jgi:hypothetical protein
MPGYPEGMTHVSLADELIADRRAEVRAEEDAERRRDKD